MFRWFPKRNHGTHGRHGNTDRDYNKKRFISVVIFALSLVSIASAQPSSKDDAALTSLVKQLADAQVAFDVSALDRIFTSDYIEISPLGEFDPRDKVLGFYKPEMKPPGGIGMTLDVSEVSIRNYGKFAVVIAKLTYTPTGGQNAPPRSIRGTFVCRREGKDWKIASAQYTGIRPPQPPKT